MYPNLTLSGSKYTFSVSSGVVSSSGIRREFEGKDLITFSASNNFYICMDNNGCIVFEEEKLDSNGNLSSPFNFRQNIHLAYINVSELKIYDIRLFIDNLDLKVANKIVVSNLKSMDIFNL